MTFEPLLIDEDKTREIYANPDCQRLFESYPEYYLKTGYNPPWIGYLVIRDGKVVGVGGFTDNQKMVKWKLLMVHLRNLKDKALHHFPANS